VYTCASAHASELGYILSQPIVCMIDVCGLRMGFRALAPEGSRVIYGPGMSVLCQFIGITIHIQGSPARQLLDISHCLRTLH
jgi:hypothetical protein